VQRYAPHEWNPERFEVLGAIREASVEFARAHGAHYFVVDCDNFIAPHTLENLVKLKELPVVAPMLTTSWRYSNWFAAVDANGYYAEHPAYDLILNRQIVGLIQVPLVHCTYFVRHSALRHVRYRDGSRRYEFVVMSDALRKAGVPQYLDNRHVYGYISFADVTQEPWFDAMLNMYVS